MAFVMEGSPAEVLLAAQKTIKSMDYLRWDIEAMTDRTMVLRVPAPGLLQPIKLFVEIVDQGDGSSTLETLTTIIGPSLGYGKLLKAKPATLANGVSVELQEARRLEGLQGSADAGGSPAATTSSVADELEKLGALWKQGIVTEDEFQIAKARLLEDHTDD